MFPLGEKLKSNKTERDILGSSNERSFSQDPPLMSVPSAKILFILEQCFVHAFMRSAGRGFHGHSAALMVAACQTGVASV